MKAFVIEQAGAPDVLKLQDISSPEPTSEEVKIRVRALGLNRAETYLRAGKMGPITAPRVPGIEAVGEVIHDPSGTFRTGQRVATAMGGMQFVRNGSYAEEVTVLRSNVISLDGSKLSWEELAALPEAYLTVWGALDKSLGIQPGQTLLVRGATSSIGLAAVTYAKARGLKVIATTRSADKVQRLRDMGADEVVIDNGAIAEQVLKLAPQGVDGVLEVVGAATVLDSLKAVRPFGAVSVMGLLGGGPVLEQLNLMQDLPAAVKLNFFGSALLGTPAMALKDSPLLWIAKEVEAGRMPSIRAKTFDFDQIPQAHRLIESNEAFGKLVVKI
ncbi:zinc-binding dehydrogenase [Pseudomonas lactis]|uniref:Zinc-binding dehydrogenase n=1 Tax=Pseudomonas lactis TaxID=1615674 RepID=A0A7Y1LBF2_9PSED|nr:zinc-binding alcohol dehydrogenase family protein [Pseudomonas lactis]NNA42873.1 zinc-binding dehydrogenase [Pseudomonas lactis]